MPSNVAQKFPDERPTQPIERLPSRTLVLATRIERLASLALERLMCAPDDDALAGACADLVLIRELAGEVLR